MLDISKIRAISLDLDDTLWPIWPTIERAEKALALWLGQQAPGAAAVFANAHTRKRIREEVERAMPGMTHDLSALRRESIRLALRQANENTDLAEPAFDIFFAERMRVDLFVDAWPALAFLAERFPLVALSNGNADVDRIGLGEFFEACISDREFGVGKPDPRIFHAAAASAGVSVEAVLHVGDDAELDVLGALSAGMQTVWVNRNENEWVHELKPHVTVTSLVDLCRMLGAESS